MARNIALALCGLAVFGLTLVWPARGQSSLIILNNADQSTTIEVAGSGALTSVIQSIAPRPIVTSANQVTRVSLVSAPPELISIIQQVAPRIQMDGANQSAIRSVAYPVAFFGDTTPAGLSSVSVASAGLDAAVLSWQTTEWAISQVHYGTQPGALNLTVADPLFAKTHAVTLPGLTARVVYYYQITSVDRSGNVAASTTASFTFSSQIKLFLPLLRR